LSKWNAKINFSSVGATYPMPNTYSQIYIQIVFAFKGWQNFIQKTHREELEKYITGIVRNRDQKMLSIFCMSDHVHLLVGLKANITISDLVRDIKAGSSGFINNQKWMAGKFNWQEGFGAFSYSRSQINNVIQYILNQEEHHKKISFRTEYIDFLKKFEIEFDEKYLFEWIE
jgi:putative transposase